MTNGTLNKKILAAAKTQSGSELLDNAKRIMRSFPLSSEKLLWDSDQARVSPEAWGTLLLAAEETDKEKLEDCNRLRAEAGLKPDKSYGRYKGVA